VQHCFPKHVEEDPNQRCPGTTAQNLKARAAQEGMSLSNFIKRELERIVERPSMREWLEDTREMKPVMSKQSAAQIVRGLRDMH
jgi:hypothetical protein